MDPIHDSSIKVILPRVDHNLYTEHNAHSEPEKLINNFVDPNYNEALNEEVRNHEQIHVRIPSHFPSNQ